MWRKLGPIWMLETGEKPQTLIKFDLFLISGGPWEIRLFRMPKILINESDIFFDGGWKISISCNIWKHSFSIIVLYLIQNNVDSLFQIAFWFSFNSIELFVKFDHWILSLDISPLDPIFNQFQNSILNEDYCNITLWDPSCLQVF